MTTQADEGATAVEYALLVALIASVALAAVLALGSQIKVGADKTCPQITTASVPAAGTPVPVTC